MLLQCDHLQPCKKCFLITCGEINYMGKKICHIFTEPITFWYIKLKNFSRFSVIFTISVCFYLWILKCADLHWKLMIDQKVKFLFQIFQPTIIPKKRFSTRKERFGVRFQMKPTPTIVSVYFSKKLTDTMAQSFKVF